MQGGRVLGRYILYDEIASGGQATVHFGTLVGPEGFSRIVAIKRLHAELAKDPDLAAAFRQEARLAVRIKHPNVASIVDVVGLAGELFLVMEYVQGETLSRLCRAASEPIPHRIALAIMCDALYGLHAAHEAKTEQAEPLLVVHRDVSPQNIMVGVDGVSRVLDFGLAKATASSSASRSGVKGKFAYLAPEQALSKPIDRRTDVFAAGVVLWEMLSGRRLFAAEEPAATLHRVLTEPIEPPGASVPPAIEAIVMKALERDPEKRFASAHDMARAIEASAELARPVEIGAWVTRVAGVALEQRAQRIAEIERLAEGVSVVVAPTSSRENEITLALQDPAVVPPPRASKAWWIAGAAALVFVVSGAFVARARVTRPAADPPPAAPSAVPSAVPSADPPRETPSAKPEASPPPSPRRAPRRTNECDPPYFFDHDGVKRFKPKCI